MRHRLLTMLFVVVLACSAYAAGGSSRLQRGRKKGNAMITPVDKGIPATATPNNTPMDVLDDNAGDQVGALQAHVFHVNCTLNSPRKICPAELFGVPSLVL